MALTEAERNELVGYLPSTMASSPRLDAWIKGAEFRVSRSYFRSAYVYALSLVVAHKSSLEAMAEDGASGPVTQKREGDISVSYGSNGNSGNSDFAMTTYGQEFLSLLQQYRRAPNITLGIGIGGLDGGDRIQSCF